LAYLRRRQNSANSSNDQGAAGSNQAKLTRSFGKMFPFQFPQHQDKDLGSFTTEIHLALRELRRWVLLALSIIPIAPCLRASTTVFAETQQADGGGPGVVLVTTFPRPADKQPCQIGLGETVELLVQNLDDWLMQLRDRGIIRSTKGDDDIVTEQMPKLRLFINEMLIRTLQPVYWTRDDTSWPWHGRMAPEEAKRHRYFVHFRLDRDASDSLSKGDWNEVLKAPGVMSQMDLTIGLVDSTTSAVETVPSWIRRGESEPTHEFMFRRVNTDLWLIAGVVLLALAIGIFVFLVFVGGLIREPALPARDDGLPPVSLGRCQMAFWFFLVITGFFFLWLITGRGDLDTINPTVLTLTGISAATALGAALITSNTADPAAAAKPPVRNYLAEIRAAREKVIAARSVGDRQVEQDSKELLGKLKRELKDWRKIHWNLWILDLLTEESDISKPRIMSFHRFQMIVWTLVLGVVFCSEVLTKLAMPTFDSTLLILMGISSGTYLGFKFPAIIKSQ
jgi:hypothetical protein